MKKTTLFILSLIPVAAMLMPLKVCAQKQSFDLVTYTPPKGWQKDVTETYTSFTTVNKKDNSWCRINIVKSTVSKGNINSDFDSEWQELVVKSYSPASAPKLNDIIEGEGWKVRTGGAQFIFDNKQAMVILTTMSGYGRCISIVATASSQDYVKDINALIASVDLSRPKTNAQPVAPNNNNNSSILGTWNNSASDQSAYAMNNGINGYIVRQYTFNANGTYTFYIKTFEYTSDHLLLTSENGTYTISGTSLTISPKKSVIQAWTKKNNVDDWGRLVSSQNLAPEKKTYQFMKNYFSGIKEWDLVLQADQPTRRDGPFNGGSAFKNAWIYSPMSPSHPLLKLPD